MKTQKHVPTAGRFVISKSKHRKKGYFTEMVVYKERIGHSRFSSRTRHERIATTIKP
jgi:hypothetical protein